jgi:hypothetical protein
VGKWIVKKNTPPAYGLSAGPAQEGEVKMKKDQQTEKEREREI